jgi:histidine ammonia-lyase
MLIIGERAITLNDFHQILTGNEKISISAKAKERVKESYGFLESFYNDKIIYGINTGLVPMAQYRIDESDRIKLQDQAIRSHASGSGNPVDPQYIRSAMVVLLNNFLQGNSGIRPEVLELIKEMIKTPAHKALSQNKLKPISVHIREALSLINGTCFMTGIGIVNLMNEKLNNILPPFINLGELGVNFGMQGAQFSAASTAAENQSLSFLNYIHTIPNNNDNQDIVSMGTNSALLVKRVIENTYQIIAIEMISQDQAIDYLKIKRRTAAQNRSVFDELMQRVPWFEEDTIKYLEKKEIKDYLCTQFIDILNK